MTTEAQAMRDAAAKVARDLTNEYYAKTIAKRQATERAVGIG